MPQPENPPLPAATSSSPRKPRRWRRRIAYFFLGLFLLLVTSYFGLWWWAKSGRDAEIAKIRAAGEPVWFSDLRKPPPDPKDDGTSLLREAIAAMKPLPDSFNSRLLNRWTDEPDGIKELEMELAAELWRDKPAAVADDEVDQEPRDGDDNDANPDIEDEDDAADEFDPPEEDDDTEDWEDAARATLRATEPPLSLRERQRLFIKTLRPYVESNREAFAKLSQALSRQSIDFQTNYDAKIPSLNHHQEAFDFFELATLLKAKCQIAAYDRRPQEALAVVREYHRLNELVRSQDNSISRTAPAFYNLEPLEFVLGSCELTDAQFAEMDRHLKDVESRLNCAQPLRVLRAIILTTTENFAYADEQKGEADQPALLGGLYRPFALWNERTFLEEMAITIQYADHGDQEARDARAQLKAAGENVPLPLKFGRITNHLFDHVFELPEWTISHRHALRAARIALRVDRYFDKKGRFPQSLADVLDAQLPAVPIDLHNGKPLQYRVLSNGFVVYPLGGNGVDDGCQHRAESADEVPLDELGLPLPPRVFDESEYYARFRVRYDISQLNHARP